MEADKLTIWLEKYWEGESTLEEERQLREAFKQGQIPKELEIYKDHFVYVNSPAQDHLMDPDFDEMILSQIEEEINNKTSSENEQEDAQSKKHISRFGYIAKGWRMAASLLLVAGAFALMQQLPGTKQGVDVQYDSAGQEAQAYEQTKKALMLVSSKLNKGTEEAARAGEIIQVSTRSILRD